MLVVALYIFESDFVWLDCRMLETQFLADRSTSYIHHYSNNCLILYLAWRLPDKIMPANLLLKLQNPRYLYHFNNYIQYPDALSISCNNKNVFCWFGWTNLFLCNFFCWCVFKKAVSQNTAHVTLCNVCSCVIQQRKFAS